MSKAAERSTEPTSFWASWGHVVALALVLVVTAVLYWPTLDYGLLNWDDKLHITANPTFGDLGAAWTQAQVHVYMPVTWSAWAIAWDLGGGDPGWLHALNVFGHLLGVVLAYLVLLRLPGVGKRAAGRWAAVVGAALFALHPLQVESVAWITSLKDIASADFALLAAWLHLRATANESKRGQAGAVIAFALAVLSKPTVVALVPALVLIRLATGESVWRRDLLVTWGAMVAVAIPSLVLTAIAQFDASHVAHVGYGDRVLVAADAFGSAIGSVLWPGTRLGMIGRSPAVVLEGTLWIGALVVLAVLAALAAWKRWPELLWGGLFMLVLVLPVSGLLAFGAQVNTTVADRYLHLALLGPAWALSAGIARCLASTAASAHCRHTMVVAISGLLAVGWVLVSNAQVAAWSSDRALWQHTLDHDAENRLALEQMGRLHNAAGEYDHAIAIGRRGVAAHPDNAPISHSLGVALASTRQMEQALPFFKRAVLSQPKWSSAWLSLIKVTRDTGKPELLLETVAELQQRQEPVDPSQRPELAFAVAEAHLRLGQHEAVVRLLVRAFEQSTGTANMHAVMGISQGSLKRPGAALRHFEQALKLQPSHSIARRNVRIARKAVERRRQ